MKASGNRVVGNTTLLDNEDKDMWESEYKRIMEVKYAKHTKTLPISDEDEKSMIEHSIEPKCDNTLHGPIFVVPRVRTQSYKSVLLEYEGKMLKPEDVAYCLISKGFSMQDVSSFTLGPILGQGLCLVNAAFSKCICIHHIEGVVDLKRKNFWKAPKNKKYTIELHNENNDNDVIDVDDNVVHSKCMLVNGKRVCITHWLLEHKAEWFPQWDLWRRSVAMCSRGDFHWKDDSEVLVYYDTKQFMDFVEWKKECYIRPSYELLPEEPVYQYLDYIHKVPNNLLV